MVGVFLNANDKSLIKQAIEMKVASLKRYQKGESPEIDAVYGKHIAVYNELALKVEKLDETEIGQKK